MKYINLEKYGNNQAIRKKYYIPESITHPAKMDIPLARWILEHYVEESDIVLDPMAGIGTTLIEGMRMFHNCVFIGVEYEPKFVEMINGFKCNGKITYKKVWEEAVEGGWIVRPMSKTWEKIFKTYEEAKTYYEREAKLIRGDVLREPSFRKAEKGLWKKMVVRAKCGKRQRHKPHYVIGNIEKVEEIANQDMFMQIGDVICVQGDARQLPKVLCDKIITSPPFAEAQSGGGIAKKGYYCDKRKDLAPDYLGKRSYMPENIGGKENISNLKYGQVDKIISSPPYSESLQQEKSGIDWSKQADRISDEPHGQAAHEQRYSPDKNNIGNLPYGQTKATIGKTYLGEILKVYEQCHKVLKIGDLMILVVKCFIRNKKVVDLPQDTIQLCEAVGFRHIKTHYRKITNPSFWRILHRQKYPEVDPKRRTDEEDILVFAKGN